ncbi:hypothetical protein CDL15_Pgr026071 [Punica granatum]|uniref:Uncharacterized protein n=1 Tax=Punica granatum TaxID=22663 RepID=A0A218WDE3_PUNGR|nr:hypothetical protein CDL15_Pgr026071 [Punica granatum]
MLRDDVEKREAEDEGYVFGCLDSSEFSNASSSGQVLMRKAKKKRKMRIIVFLPSTIAGTLVITLLN